METSTAVERPPTPMALTPHERAIVETVLYSSLFDYPMTAAELSHGLIRETLDEGAIERAYAASPALRRLVTYRDGLFFPSDRPDLPARRRKREPASRAVIAAHERLLRWTCAIPFTRLVALSGSAAHLNMNGHADVDLFILTRGSRAWSVTVAVLLLARAFGQRRTLCLNYVLSDRQARLGQDDLYTANQIIHLRPLVGSDTLDWLIARNPFVSSWYPNRRAAREADGRYAPGPVVGAAKRFAERLLDLGPAVVCEWAARKLLGGYLSRRLTGCRSPREVTLAPAALKLHANGHRDAVLRRFNDRLAVTVAALETPDT